MLGKLSRSALTAVIAECSDRQTARAIFQDLIANCEAKWAYVYRFDNGLASAAEEWKPLYISFPAEIIDYYKNNQCFASDSLARAAFSSYLPIRLADVVDSFEMSSTRTGLHDLFRKYGGKDMLAMHVADRPGRLTYICLGYDRLLDDLCEFNRRRIHAIFEIFARHAGPLVTAAPARKLSPKERDVLSRLARGDSNKEIARMLGLSLSTVNTLVNRCYGKLGAHTRTEAAIAAARSSLSLVA